MTPEQKVTTWIALYCQAEGTPYLSIQDGGLVFRELSLKTGLTQERVVQIASTEGWWPHSLADIKAFYEKRNYGAENADDYLCELIAVAEMTNG